MGLFVWLTYFLGCPCTISRKGLLICAKTVSTGLCLQFFVVTAVAAANEAKLVLPETEAESIQYN